MVMQIVSTLVELVRIGRQSESDKDLEILLLRRAIYERRQKQAPRLSRGEKSPLVVLGTKPESPHRAHAQSDEGDHSEREVGDAF
jgi:hypothetical protein